MSTCYKTKFLLMAAALLSSFAMGQLVQIDPMGSNELTPGDSLRLCARLDPCCTGPYLYQWKIGDSLVVGTDSCMYVKVRGNFCLSVTCASGCKGRSCTEVRPCNIITQDLSTGRRYMPDTLLPPGPEPNWKLSTINSIATPPPNSAFVIAPSTFWAPPLPGTQWISFANTAQAGISATYTYRRLFNVAAPDDSLRLELDFMVDDRGSVLLNGFPIISNYSGFSTHIHAHASGMGYFRVGTNTLEVHTGNDFAPHGFDLRAILSGCSATLSSIVSAPEPAREAFGEGIVLYPNPATEILYVTGAPENLRLEYLIFNIWGQVLIRSNSPILDIQALAAGMYFLGVSHKSGSKVIRFVKL